MMIKVVMCLLISAWRSDALEISHMDLEAANSTCEGATCDSRLSTYSAECGSRNCMCDRKCITYGDCCLDSNYFSLTEQRRAITMFQCIPYNETIGYYVKMSCPPSWRSLEIRRQCEVSLNPPKHDPLIGTPVTSMKNGITYGNIYCALCHGERNTQKNIVYWRQKLTCPEMDAKEPSASYDYTKNLMFNEITDSWQLNYQSRILSCSLNSVVPESVSQHFRACSPNLIKACPGSWLKSDIRANCEAYTSLVYSENNAYRNLHCAICNNYPVHKLQCANPNISCITTRFPSVEPFAVLFDFQGKDTVGKVKPCEENQLYDPFLKQCRDIIEESPKSERSEASDYTLSNINQYGDKIIVRQKLNCTRYVINSTEFILKADNTLFVPLYNRIFKMGEFATRPDDRAEICVDSQIGVKYVPKYRPYLNVITACGLIVSIICLLLHLLAFCITPSLRNLSGKNLASFSFALLVTYCSFYFGYDLKGKACFANAVLTYYALLASFVWMLTMSFDVWRTLKQSTSALRVNTGQQWKKFLYYSLWSWLFPAKIVALAVFCDILMKGVINEKFRPNFGVTTCWFGHGEAIFIFLGIPVLTILSINIIFFGSSSWTIYSSKSVSRSSNSNVKRDFRLYTRLALIMGLTWITGLIAGLLDNEWLWLLFVLLNTMQGFFVFAAFTCRSHVWNAVRMFVGNTCGVCPPDTPECYVDPTSRKFSKTTTTTTY